MPIKNPDIFNINIKRFFNIDIKGLSPKNVKKVQLIKKKAEELRKLLMDDFESADQRCLNNSIERLEESVMWGVKSITITKVKN